jgi:hypothetical protein
LRHLIEPIAVVTGLALVVAFAPLESTRFPDVVPVAATGTFAYAVVGAIWFRGAAEEWGLVPPPRSDLEVVHGCLGMGVLTLVSFAPIVMVHLLKTRPAMSHPVTYLVWCAVQDLLFFSLFLRNAAGFVTVNPAVFLTAALFGLSHYPHGGFMYVTGLVGIVWGYVFVYTRLLWVVTASHFLLGVLVLA